MHKYLRCIGFSKYRKRTDVNKILKAACQDPTETAVINDEDDIYGYVSCSFGKNMGIRVLGIYDEEHHFREDYYFPYVESDVISTRIPMEVEQYIDRPAYGGIVDDPSLGIAVIFYLTNGIELSVRRNKSSEPEIEGISLNGLSTSGKILLPLHKSENEQEKLKIAAKDHDKMLEAARGGDEDAMESLAMQEMAIIQNINERIAREDVYTLVDTCFMPYGLESDLYSVVGEIRQAEKIRNRMTGEECWQMILDCNGMPLTVMINAEDLLGEPAEGRRFKGEIWLQGTALFRE